MEDNEQIGRRLADLRESFRATQQEWADLLQKNRATVSLMEKGKSSITVETILALRETYNFDINVLLTGKPYQPSNLTKTQTVRGSYNRTEMDVNHINDTPSGSDPEKEYMKKRIEDLEKQVDEYRRLYQALLEKL